METVDVDEKDGRLDAVGELGTRQGPLEPVEEELFVGKPGEAVVHRIVQQAVAAGAVFVDVLQRADDAGDLAVAAEHRLHAHAEGAVVAVGGCRGGCRRDLAAAQLDQRIKRRSEAIAVFGWMRSSQRLMAPRSAPRRSPKRTDSSSEMLTRSRSMFPVEDEIARAGERQGAALDFAERADRHLPFGEGRAAPR